MLLESLKRGWSKPPICTSLPIQVWQRYLLATTPSEEEWPSRVLTWMPLRSDRTLPGELFQNLLTIGEGKWRRLEDKLRDRAQDESTRISSDGSKKAAFLAAISG